TANRRNRALEEWLETKGRYLIVKAQVERLSSQLNQYEENKKKLTRFLDDEVLLRKRAADRLESLEAQLETIKKEQQSGEKDVKEAYSELEMMRRITKRGRVVELARRVAKREHKWYLANWVDEENTGAINQLDLGEDVGIRDFERRW